MRRDTNLKNSQLDELNEGYDSLSLNPLAGETDEPTQLAWRQGTVHFITLLAGIGLILSGCSKPSSVFSSEQTEPIVNSGSSDRTSSPDPADSNFIVAAVNKVGPAVVRIDSSKALGSRAPTDDPSTRQFGEGGGQSEPSKRIVRGIGSGFIVDASGQILTNAHVVNGADTVEVTLKDGRSFKGRVLGEDQTTDVAVVKIQASNLPVVAIGNSDTLRPGAWAIAIGNPLGLDNSVTAGIISAINRSSSQVGVPNERVGFIQTDTAINPGNSGGPLLNSRGEVVGINTAIISGAQGLGFAIPVNTAQGIAQQLIAKGKVEHAYLGIQMTALTPEVKQKLGEVSNGRFRVTADQGVLLIRIVSGSPAAQAGLRVGDVIQKINNQSVTTPDEVQRLVERSKVGSQLQMEVQRNGQSTQVAVRTASLPVQPPES